MTSDRPTPIAPDAQAGIGELARELAHTRNAVDALRAEVDRLEASLQTVDGRTLRHEAGQDLARELKQDLGRLAERLEAEAALRRDLAAAVDRAGSRDHHFEAELRRALEIIAGRLDTFEGHQSATDERQRSLASGIAGREREDDTIEHRVLDLERQIAALRDARVEHGEEIARTASALPELERRLDLIDGQIAAVRAARQRHDEEIAALRAIRDREEELLDLLEQQRATRTRHEARLAEIEELVAGVTQALAAAGDDRARLGREQAGAAERLRTFDERLEALRISIVEHLRLQLRADEQAGRRRVEETERELRTARSLVTRLSEQTEDAVQEQPL
jgi:chromosome segregation ATPase